VAISSRIIRAPRTLRTVIMYVRNVCRILRTQIISGQGKKGDLATRKTAGSTGKIKYLAGSKGGRHGGFREYVEKHSKQTDREETTKEQRPMKYSRAGGEKENGGGRDKPRNWENSNLRKAEAVELSPRKSRNEGGKLSRIQTDDK